MSLSELLGVILIAVGKHIRDKAAEEMEEARKIQQEEETEELEKAQNTDENEVQEDASEM